MERVIESKKTKIVLVLLILLTMLSSYLPSITLAGTDDESEMEIFMKLLNMVIQF